MVAHVHCAQLIVCIAHSTAGGRDLEACSLGNLDPIRVLLVAIRDHHRNLTETAYRTFMVGLELFTAYQITNCITIYGYYPPYSDGWYFCEAFYDIFIVIWRLTTPQL